MQSVAEKLKNIINARGVTYSAISRKTGIQNDSISKVFLGKRRMTADEMMLICGFLNIDLKDLNEQQPAQQPSTGQIS